MSELEPLRTRGFLQPIMGTLGKSLSFHFTGVTMVPDSALLKLHRDLVKQQAALAGVAQWTECWPVNYMVNGSIPNGSIPSQGTCLGCRPPPRRRVCERQPRIDVSLPLFLPPFPSVKVNK